MLLYYKRIRLNHVNESDDEYMNYVIGICTYRDKRNQMIYIPFELWSGVY